MSVNDFVVRARALALRDHPGANGAYVDGVFNIHARVNVGVAVAVAGDGTLVVPTIADAGAKRRPVVYERDIVRRSIMDLSLSCDDRILYGADAASFLADLRALLERPWALVS